jgi:hypothetical protein
MTDATASTPLFRDESFASIARLHGLPDFVMPLHVVAGFRESERGIRASGVRPVNSAIGVGLRSVIFDLVVLAGIHARVGGEWR